MASTGFSSSIRVRNRRGARLEPKGGWRLGVKTAAAPPGAGGPDPEETPEERSSREKSDRIRASRLSDDLARRDVSQSGLPADYSAPGTALVRRFRGGTERRTAHHGDPVEDIRTSSHPSTSVWVQDNRPEHLKEEAREDEPRLRLEFEGRAAVSTLRTAVVDGMQQLVTARWSTLTDRSIAGSEEVGFQAAKRQQAADGRVPALSNYSAIAAENREVVPPLRPSVVAVNCDPALFHLATGEYDGARYEPPVVHPDQQHGDVPLDVETELGGLRLPADEHSRLVQSEAPGIIDQAQQALERQHVDLCLVDPDASERVEKQWVSERVALCDDVAQRAAYPEESRVLLGAMRDYVHEMTPVWDEARFVGRVTAALGKDPKTDPLDSGVLDAVRTQFPDVQSAVCVAQIPSSMAVDNEGVVDPQGAAFAARLHAALGRDPLDHPLATEPFTAAVEAYPPFSSALAAVDPDSPLLVAPPGLEARYEDVLLEAVDRAVHVPAVTRGPGTVADLQLDVAESCVATLDRGSRDPWESQPEPQRVAVPPVSVPSPALGSSPELVAERLSVALESFGEFGVDVAVEGGPRSHKADLLLDPQQFEAAEQLVDGRSRLIVSVRDGVDAETAVPAAFSRLGSAVMSGQRGLDDPVGKAADAFGVRVASRVLDQPLDDALLGDRSALAVPAVGLVGELTDAADTVARRDVDRLAARFDAADRFEAVVQAFESRGVRVDPPDSLEPDRSAAFGCTAEGDPLVSLSNPALVSSDPAVVSDVALGKLHAEAYVAFGRASGSFAWKESPRLADYTAVSSSLEPGTLVGPELSSDLSGAKPSLPHLREQLVADAFATAQMAETWNGAQPPLRSVSKVPDGHGLAVDPKQWPAATPAYVAAEGRSLVAAANKASSQVALSIEGVSAVAPPPPEQPSPAVVPDPSRDRERPGRA